MNDDHALTGAYAADALDPRERAQVEEHLRHCAPCRQEVQSLREALTELSGPLEQAPPAALRQRVLAEAAMTPQVVRAGSELGVHPTHRRRERPRWRTAVLSLAAAVTLTLAGTLAWQEWYPTPPMTEQVMQAQDATHMDGALEGGGQIALVRSASMDHAVIMGKDLPTPREGYAYQAWVKDAHGTMHADAMVPMDGRPALLEMPLSDAMEVGVTIEPMSGSPAPTSGVIGTISLVDRPGPAPSRGPEESAR